METLVITQAVVIKQSYDFWGEAWDFTVCVGGCLSTQTAMHILHAERLADQLTEQYPDAVWVYENIDPNFAPCYV